jgi:hypothetical protein
MPVRRNFVSYSIASQLVWPVVFVLALLAPPRAALAESHDASESVAPVQLSFWGPLQVYDESSSVSGVRLALLSGTNQDVTGLDLLGIASLTRGDQKGLQIGLYNEVNGDLAGWQLGGFAGEVDGRARGLQTAAVYNRAGDAVGTQFAVGMNRTESMRGLQISLVNWTDDLEGVQIGLINIHRNGWLPFLPFFNFGF